MPTTFSPFSFLFFGDFSLVFVPFHFLVLAQQRKPQGLVRISLAF